ncbi:hypothetical protein OKW33_006424 [Paraburkholderia atlantica]|uniref:Uncharacterized protein n=1 Tax=Paraburkholderia atlantica TaxID=2654982 RepID=A0A6I1QAK0_PARAM|nr:hypothetical protein [Paraburkholderia atlantica]MBB5429709.1 hypothetical protein [Paraburkholderia atlantica]MPW11451.1 hypothetical protein [Paraburkholderia atlantica]NUY35875.1 hypothetical protein [Paraburkholderia atlantica]
MAKATPPDVELSVHIDAGLNARLLKYAHEHGVTPESVMIEGVCAFMSTFPLRENRVPRKRRGSSEQ